MSVEITQADREAAGELWLALGFDIPDANDGNAAAMLETMAVAFAETRSTSTEEVERLFDIEPDLSADTPEPSLRTIVFKYYAEHFDRLEADVLTGRYFAALGASNHAS